MLETKSDHMIRKLLKDVGPVLTIQIVKTQSPIGYSMIVKGTNNTSSIWSASQMKLAILKQRIEEAAEKQDAKST